MYFYILQEQVGDYWNDLYKNDLCFLKKMIIVLKRKDLSKKYRIVRLYQ